MAEIIAVEETDSHGKHYGGGKWQKMETPFAFTGSGASVSPPTRSWSLTPGGFPERGFFVTLTNLMPPWFIFMRLPCVVFHGVILISVWALIMFYFLAWTERAQQ